VTVTAAVGAPILVFTVQLPDLATLPPLIPRYSSALPGATRV